MKLARFVGCLAVVLTAACSGSPEVRNGPQATHPGGSRAPQATVSAALSAPAVRNKQQPRVQQVSSAQPAASRRIGKSRTTARKSVQIGNVKVTWADFTNVHNRNPNASALQQGEGVFIFSRAIQSVATLPDGTQVNSSECYNKMLRATDPALQNAYLRCHNSGSRQNIPFEQFVSLARQAVRSEGNCTWVGYDRAFDLSVRATGKLASASDLRLFFAKLRCRG